MHEFCHILGLVHEQQLYSVTNPYREQNMFKDSAGDAYKIIPNTTNLTDFDPESIMLYPVTRCVLKPESIQTDEQKQRLINTRLNLKLSQNDCTTLAFYYPKFKLPNIVENYCRNNKSNNYTLLYFLVLCVLFFFIYILIV